MITVSDIMFCAVVTAWVYLLVVQADMRERISMKLVIAVSVIYEIASQILSLMLGRYDSFMLHVQSGAGKVVLQILNLSYNIAIIAIGMICMAAFFKKFQNSNLKRGKYFLFQRLRRIKAALVKTRRHNELK